MVIGEAVGSLLQLNFFVWNRGIVPYVISAMHLMQMFKLSSSKNPKHYQTLYRPSLLFPDAEVGNIYDVRLQTKCIYNHVFKIQNHRADSKYCGSSEKGVQIGSRAIGFSSTLKPAQK